MSLSKNDVGSHMYPWVDFMHTIHRGECPHRCGYCQARRGRAKRHYSGPIRLAEKEFTVRYDKPGVYFIEHMFDLFADGVPAEHTERILGKLREWGDNTYVLQTKNPLRMLEYITALPPHVMLGITVETNRWYRDAMGNAPCPLARCYVFARLQSLSPALARFVTIEPILDFDVVVLADCVSNTGPHFVNIGADSKGCGLPEPTGEKVRELIRRLEANGIEVRLKKNLGRLVGETAVKSEE